MYRTPRRWNDDWKLLVHHIPPQIMTRHKMTPITDPKFSPYPPTYLLPPSILKITSNSLFSVVDTFS